MQASSLLSNGTISEICHCTDSFDRYMRIMDLGISAPEMPQEYADRAEALPSCEANSSFFLTSDDQDVKLYFDSDSLYVMGIASIYIALCAQAPKRNLAHETLGLADLLSERGIISAQQTETFISLERAIQQFALNHMSPE